MKDNKSTALIQPLTRPAASEYDERALRELAVRDWGMAVEAAGEALTRSWLTGCWMKEIQERPSIPFAQVCREVGISRPHAYRLIDLAGMDHAEVLAAGSLRKALKVSHSETVSKPKKSGARRRREEHAERLGAPAEPLTAADVDELAAEHAAGTATSKPPPQHPRETAAQEDYRQRYNRLKRQHGALRGRLETDAASGNPYAASLLAQFYGRAVK